MAFSKEWDEVYRNNKQMSVWPWTDLVSLVKHYVDLEPGDRVLELGCGAGANIPFLTSIPGVKYYAVEGSQYIVDLLSSKYADNEDVVIECADFTEEIPFDGEFRLVIDRSAIVHNVENDIKKVLKMVYNLLAENGAFVGLDWHSTCYSFFCEEREEYESLDELTRIYRTGIFAGSGITHFSNENHIRNLLKDFQIATLYEKRYDYLIPQKETRGGWDFVAIKGD